MAIREGDLQSITSTPEHLSGACVFNLSGDLDVHTSKTAKRELLSLVEDPKLLRLVLDLSGVAAIDSAGLGLLLVANRRLWERGGALVLRGTRPVVCRALAATHMIDLFQIER